MNITIFNKRYWVRRFGEQTEVRGHITTEHEDFTASLNVHPGSESEQAQPEGERRVRRLEAHGTDLLRSANHDIGQKGDLLWYHGDWYECVSAVEWDHTILNHWNYSFVQVALDAGGSIDMLEPPETDPEKADEKLPPIAGPVEPGFFKVGDDSGLQVDRCGHLSLTEDAKQAVRRKFGGGVP